MNDYATPCKELSLGEQIFNLMNGYSPKEQRQALREAEERVHQNFNQQAKEMEEKLKTLHSLWQEFKG